MERSQAYVDVCVRLRTSDNIYILFLGTLGALSQMEHIMCTCVLRTYKGLRCHLGQGPS